MNRKELLVWSTRRTHAFGLQASAISLVSLCLIDCNFSVAFAEHAACPDYSKYSEVLRDGTEQLRLSGSNGGDINERKAVLDYGPYPAHYLSLKYPQIQVEIDAAASAEDLNDLHKAEYYWHSILCTLDRNALKGSPVHAMAYSRLADVYILLSQPDIAGGAVDPTEPRYSTEQLRSYVAGRARLGTYADRSPLSIPGFSISLRSRWERALAQLCKRSDSTKNCKDNDKYLQQAIDCSKRAVELGSAVRDRTGPNYGLDLIRLATLEAAAGNTNQKTTLMNEAVSFFTTVNRIEPIASARDSRFLVCGELLPFTAKNAPDKVDDLLAQLCRYFSYAIMPGVMEHYAREGDAARVSSAYKAYAESFKYFPLARQIKENSGEEDCIRVASALSRTEQWSDATEFCKAWVEVNRGNAIATAWAKICEAGLSAKSGDDSKSKISFEASIDLLDQIKPNSIESAQTLIATCDQLTAGLSKQNSSYAETLVSSRELLQRAHHQLMQIECLTLSQNLVRAGEQLQRKGNFESATKLLAAASDIKQKNLGDSDEETLKQKVDTGRALFHAGKKESALAQVALATKQLRSLPSRDDDFFRSALELYADMLSQSNKEADAQKIYEELRGMPTSRD